MSKQYIADELFVALTGYL